MIESKLGSVPYRRMCVGALAVVLVTVVGPARMKAQRLANQAAFPQTRVDSVDPVAARMAHRLGSAVVLGVGGGILVGLGTMALCGDCIISAAQPVLLTWLVTGSAIGAALPRGNGRCSGSERFARALAGTSLGFGAGLLLVKSDASYWSYVATIPLSSIVFLGRC